VGCTGLGAPLEGAVDTVPTGDAEASPIFALTVEAAPRIAASILTPSSGPTFSTNAGGVLTSKENKSEFKKSVLSRRYFFMPVSLDFLIEPHFGARTGPSHQFNLV
jgi:hypothetical protein